MTAKLIKKLETRDVWELDPPFVEKDWNNKEVKKHKYVTTMIHNIFLEGDICDIVPCSQKGFISEFEFLHKVYSKTKNPARALKDIGYNII